MREKEREKERERKKEKREIIRDDGREIQI